MDVEGDIRNEDQFWDELDDIVSTPCRTQDRIDDTLRTYLSFVASYRERYVASEQSVLKCTAALLAGPLFEKNFEYIRRQLVYSLLQVPYALLATHQNAPPDRPRKEDDQISLHLVTAFLLFDGRRRAETFELMSSEGAFSRLVLLIKEGNDDGLGLHRHFLELLYEMSRVQQISWEELTSADESFALYLLQIVEGLSSDVNDPHHSPVIRALLVLNEQYMILAHDPLSPQSAEKPVTNPVIYALSVYGGVYKTFGENLILLLNRETETSSQLLILKLLYLSFTNPPTQEYFYTNDLYVLIDILIRNLLDLPDSTVSATVSLRHTYLRVLHPLLANTQLRQPPHYKREELRKMLQLLGDAGEGTRHFERPDETTVRLVGRCLGVEWLKDPEDGATERATSVPEVYVETVEDQADGDSSPAKGTGSAVVAKKALGLNIGQLPEARESSVSVMEVAAQREKPGIITPSKKSDAAGADAGKVEGDWEASLKSPFDDDDDDDDGL